MHSGREDAQCAQNSNFWQKFNKSFFCNAFAPTSFLNYAKCPNCLKQTVLLEKKLTEMAFFIFL